MDSGNTRPMPKIKRGGPPPSDNSYAAIGKRLRLLRLAFGKTQEDMAEIIGVNYTMISRCERGGARLSADHMLKVLDRVRCAAGMALPRLEAPLVQ